MKPSGRGAGSGSGLTLAGLLLVLGVALVGLAAITPWHTDPDAYFSGLGVIESGLQHAGGADYRAASSAFHALEDQYRTLKWVYADVSYSALAWAGLVLLVVAFRRGRAREWTTRRFSLVFAVTAVGLALLMVGLLAGPLQQMGRHQVPPWADSYGIVVFSTLGAMTIFAPVVAVLTLSPILLTRRKPAPLLSLGTGWIGGAVTGLVYILPLFVAGILVATVGLAGGWATSTAGALLGWAFLNARAVWLGIHPPRLPDRVPGLRR